MDKIREPRLSLEDLGVSNVEDVSPPGESIDATSDPVFKAVITAFFDGFAGVILRGPPGTGKSWYAKEIAKFICGGVSSACKFVQFHPSYQYEDFIEGWVPTPTGGFAPQAKLFLNLCDAAAADPSQSYVLVIDELSRADAARVFGEALTYLEVSKRGMEFQLSSGRTASIPKNILVIATMNPWDRGVDEVDIALLRRFAIIDMEPDAANLRGFLEGNGVKEEVISAAERFFLSLQKQQNPMLHIGHAYFQNVHDEAGLQRLWTYQLLPHLQMVCRLELDELRKIEGMWKQMIIDGIPAPDAAVAEQAPADPSVGA